MRSQISSNCCARHVKLFGTSRSTGISAFDPEPTRPDAEIRPVSERSINPRCANSQSKHMDRVEQRRAPRDIEVYALSSGGRRSPNVLVRNARPSHREPARLQPPRAPQLASALEWRVVRPETTARLSGPTLNKRSMAVMNGRTAHGVADRSDAHSRDSRGSMPARAKHIGARQVIRRTDRLKW